MYLSVGPVDDPVTSVALVTHLSPLHVTLSLPPPNMVNQAMLDCDADKLPVCCRLYLEIVLRLYMDRAALMFRCFQLHRSRAATTHLHTAKHPQGFCGISLSRLEFLVEFTSRCSVTSVAVSMRLRGARLLCVRHATDCITKQVCMCEGLRIACAWQVDCCCLSEVSQGCLMVLMTSLSVLTTEGWMMVAPQGTATTGGLTKRMQDCVCVVCVSQPVWSYLLSRIPRIQLTLTFMCVVV